MAACLSARESIVAAYCFGSQTRSGHASPRDIDVAVLARSLLDLRELLDIRRDLVLLLGTDNMDVVDLHAAGPVLQRSVVAADTRFYCCDEHTANEFELRTLRAYQDSAYRRNVQYQYLSREASPS